MGSRRSSRNAAPPAQLGSSEPVLFLERDMPLGADVPARDLTFADLAYIHRVRALRASGGMPVDPATADELEALAAELSGSGAFSRTAPAPAAPAEKE